jgi:hypothetical protein
MHRMVHGTVASENSISNYRWNCDFYAAIIAPSTPRVKVRSQRVTQQTATYVSNVFGNVESRFPIQFPYRRIDTDQIDSDVKSRLRRQLSLRLNRISRRTVVRHLHGVKLAERNNHTRYNYH